MKDTNNKKTERKQRKDKVEKEERIGQRMQCHISVHINRHNSMCLNASYNYYYGWMISYLGHANDKQNPRWLSREQILTHLAQVERQTLDGS